MLYAVSIPTAVLGAVFLSLGALLQRRGVQKSRNSSGPRRLGLQQLRALLRRRSWLAGTGALVVAVLLQLVSVANAPLIVIQPIGSIALVVTALADARGEHRRLLPAQVTAVAICLAGIVAFVAVTASTASDPVITTTRVLVVLGLLAVVVLVLGVSIVLRRERLNALIAVVGAGVANGFVATVGKVLIRRLEQHDLDWFTALCFLGVLAAGSFGIYLVQTAYLARSASLVIAGLTIIDPIVAVLLGILVLGEATGAPGWAPAAYLLAGGISAFGVIQVAQADHHAGKGRQGNSRGVTS